jgi:hypothetical protein
MTSDDGKPRPAPYVDEDDLLSLAADMGAGYFSAGHLYEWYTSTIKNDGRLPVSKKAFGVALRTAGWLSSLRTVEPGRQARCWLINKPWARRGEAWLAEQNES